MPRRWPRPQGTSVSRARTPSGSGRSTAGAQQGLRGGRRRRVTVSRPARQRAAVDRAAEPVEDPAAQRRRRPGCVSGPPVRPHRAPVRRPGSVAERQAGERARRRARRPRADLAASGRRSTTASPTAASRPATSRWQADDAGRPGRRGAGGRPPGRRPASAARRSGRDVTGRPSRPRRTRSSGGAELGVDAWRRRLRRPQPPGSTRRVGDDRERRRRRATRRRRGAAASSGCRRTTARPRRPATSARARASASRAGVGPTRAARGRRSPRPASNGGRGQRVLAGSVSASAWRRRRSAAAAAERGSGLAARRRGARRPRRPRRPVAALEPPRRRRPWPSPRRSPAAAACGRASLDRPSGRRGVAGERRSSNRARGRVAGARGRRTIVPGRRPPSPGRRRYSTNSSSLLARTTIWPDSSSARMTWTILPWASSTVLSRTGPSSSISSRGSPRPARTCCA